jgi:predicted nucleic acid-binding protein
MTASPGSGAIVTIDSAEVLDASVLVKCFLEEVGSDLARREVGAKANWIAPELIFLEVASVATQALRRRLIAPGDAETIMSAAPTLLAETTPIKELAAAAFRLAADHGVTPYDGAYLALAISRGVPLLTADAKLVDLARRADLLRFVRLLG